MSFCMHFADIIKRFDIITYFLIIKLPVYTGNTFLQVKIEWDIFNLNT